MIFEPIRRAFKWLLDAMDSNIIFAPFSSILQVTLFFFVKIQFKKIRNSFKYRNKESLLFLYQSPRMTMLNCISKLHKGISMFLHQFYSYDTTPNLLIKRKIKSDKGKINQKNDKKIKTKKEFFEGCVFFQGFKKVSNFLFLEISHFDWLKIDY